MRVIAECIRDRQRESAPARDPCATLNCPSNECNSITIESQRKYRFASRAASVQFHSDTEHTDRSMKLHLPRPSAISLMDFKVR